MFRDGRPKLDMASGWQIGSAVHDLMRLLSLNPLTAGAEIVQDKVIIVREPPDARTLRCLEFQTTRYGGGGRRGQGEETSFTVAFPKEVTGPLALGYSSHFGLGLFVPVLPRAG
jgi:CRISPR-associated protein Csb2